MATKVSIEVACATVTELLAYLGFVLVSAAQVATPKLLRELQVASCRGSAIT